MIAGVLKDTLGATAAVRKARGISTIKILERLDNAWDFEKMGDDDLSDCQDFISVSYCICLTMILICTGMLFASISVSPSLSCIIITLVAF